ncbi:adhesion G protein-coupled receptor E1-like isoform X3 [Trematomus bernacchii]|uniref:adhesion G protein-coupled receptor E1-like isoform X3 n=1 Tax=Trematomus bernacchii TaxID=40690 RepID=UPI00146EA245|nr:adhesion G protein-coupled receptor E1-like isoform X3 [Trematomus bernacchii]
MGSGKELLILGVLVMVRECLTECSLGFNTARGQKCVDRNECEETPGICRGHADCFNTNGSFLCRCHQGYSQSEGLVNFTKDGHCQEVNECIEFTNICGAAAQCTNLVGSYECTTCNLGYSNNGFSHCTDMNECEETPGICREHADCFNTNGSFLCRCHQGYSHSEGLVNFTKDRHCQEVNECIEFTNICGAAAQCTNLVGSYECTTCNLGYSNNGFSNCTGVLVMVRECLTECSLGFNTARGQKCVDMNECEETPGICRGHADCFNTNGSFLCRCHQGYSHSEGLVNFTKDGHCQEVNECIEFTNICGAAAQCTNLVGSYECTTCNLGYSNNGFSNCTADHSLLVCGVRAAVVVFALIGIAVYFAWKNKNYKKAEGSAYRPEREHQDESVVMVEM